MEILFNPVIQHFIYIYIYIYIDRYILLFNAGILARNKRRIELTTFNFSNDIPASKRRLLSKGVFFLISAVRDGSAVKSVAR